MPKYSSKDVQVVVFGGYDLRADLLRTAFGRETLSEEQLPPGETYPLNHQLGIHRATLQQSGLFNDAALASHEALVTLQGAATSGIYARFGNTQGNECKVFRGLFAAEVGEPTPAGQLVKFDATYRVDGDVGQAFLVAPQQTITSNSETILDTGDSPSSAGCYLCIQVIGLELDTADDLTITTYEGPDGGPWTQIDQQVISTDGPHAFFVETAGDVDTHIRVTWAYGGTIGSATSQIVVAFKRLGLAVT